MTAIVVVIWPLRCTYLRRIQPKPAGGAVQYTWMLVRLRGVLSVTAGGQLVINCVSSSSMICEAPTQTIISQTTIQDCFAGLHANSVQRVQIFFFCSFLIQRKSFSQIAHNCQMCAAISINGESSESDLEPVILLICRNIKKLHKAWDTKE